MSSPEASPPDRGVLPRFVPPHDPGFRPMILTYRKYLAGMTVEKAVPLRIALEREGGFVSTFETNVPGEGPAEGLGPFVVERIVKFLLWSRGGWKITLEGPASVGEHIRAVYREGGARDFDVRLMSRVYEKPFEVVLARPGEFPEARESHQALGGHWEGCRIGFDLGASDYKIAAVEDGVPVFSEEIPWAPSEAADPEYHYRHIMDGLKKAASRLPRVDAIGGSSAGIYIGNLVRIASLFRAVPQDLFDPKIKPLFLRIRDEWGVPFEVINDGEVTALAGMMSLGDTAVLGVAMGSSEAAGFLNAAGHIPGWLDELAFAPVDANPDAPADEWSGDRGVGANYFSQQAVNRLALAAGLKFPEAMRLPERLKQVQGLAEAGDARAAGVFEAVGTYLGYTIPWYGVFYDYRNLLVLGRVLSGRGGNIIVAKARDVLRSEFPETAARMRLQLLDEKSRRVGQAVAAASLPGLARPAEIKEASS
jgi:predicted NBD/HSP70 family sugar kinase